MNNNEIISESDLKVAETDIEQNINSKSEIKKGKKKILPIVISFFVLILILGISLTIITINNQKQKREAEYNDSMISVAKEMYVLEVAAEYHSTYLTQIWYNAIFKNRDSYTDKYTFPEDSYGYGVRMWSDFQTAIRSYLSDNKDELQKLKEEESKINVKLSELQDIPNEQYQKHLDILTEMYSNFSMMVSLSNNPTGTYKEYQEKRNKYSEQFESEYNKLLILVPEIQVNEK